MCETLLACRREGELFECDFAWISREERLKVAAEEKGEVQRRCIHDDGGGGGREREKSFI